MAVELHHVHVPPLEQEFLAGAQAGRRFGQRLLQLGRCYEHPCVLVVDFSAATIATGSWLREAILRVNWSAPIEAPNLYLALTGCSVELQEELELLLDHTGDVLTLVELQDKTPVHACLIGRLTDTLKDAFNTVRHSHRISATELAKNDSELTAPAWNNRLTSLHERRIVATERPNRARYYEPILPGVIYGDRFCLKNA